jgi:hypothetical protein
VNEDLLHQLREEESLLRVVPFGHHLLEVGEEGAEQLPVHGR